MKRLAPPPPPPVAADDDGVDGRLVGDDRATELDDRPRQLHTRGISAYGDGEGRGVAAIDDCDDERAWDESSYGAVAQARCRECAASAAKALRRRLPALRTWVYGPEDKAIEMPNSGTPRWSRPARRAVSTPGAGG